MRQKKYSSQKKETTSVQNPVLIESSKYNCLMYRQQSGLFRSLNDPDRKVRVGLPGMADSAMIVPVRITQEMVGQVVGLGVQIEFKEGSGQQQEKQKKWQKAVERAHGIYKIVRSVDEFKQFMNHLQRNL